MIQNLNEMKRSEQTLTVRAILHPDVNQLKLLGKRKGRSESRIQSYYSNIQKPLFMLLAEFLI